VTRPLVECTRLHASLSLEACVGRHTAIKVVRQSKELFAAYELCSKCEVGAERLVQLRTKDESERAVGL